MKSKTEMPLVLPFTHDDCEAAFASWGCNCGPSALAAILGLKLDQVRSACESSGFAERRYMSPTMMKSAVKLMDAYITPRAILNPETPALDFPEYGLVRIQWHGPWTEPGANPKWAYRQTHWVASWCFKQPFRGHDGHVWTALKTPAVFDINGGLQVFKQWEEEVVPLIIESVPRANGKWSITHSWEIFCNSRNEMS